jgi:CheY-like chemotaxis protein
MLDRIFNFFTQSENARLHSPGGLGIGLSLAKWLVEMHDGTISVSSAGLDQGSEFTVTLPLAPEQPPQSDAWHLANAALPYRKILIADDNVDAADTIALLLETPECEIRTVYGGDAAVREAERFQPDLVLLDLEMPGIDGYESCRRIRSCPWSAKTVLVALSGWGQSDGRSVLAGFDLHLMKPVDPDNLVHALRDIRPRAT